ncbi:Amino-acid acetyltransferase, mitochondrial [Coemansia aciculifera]|uniref:Amino-acid acetyltransferase, mitochondrial n=1 Tax=Coemansia aciculifera TaxID=417176 RepID=A0ACC1M2B9_9FUNG|nr:Amino-acid acetyltransferase, mitochondrial [Coemansia aciculifera]
MFFRFIQRPLFALQKRSIAGGISQGQQTNRTRELILSVLSTVPSPREAHRFLDSVSGRETLRSQREFEERQAQEARSQLSPDAQLVPGEFLHLHHRHQQPSLSKIAALVCIEEGEGEDVGKLLAQMQRIGVMPIVLLSRAAGKGTGRTHGDVVASAFSLADKVEQEGGRARPICDGVFTEETNSRVVMADGEPIAAAIAQGLIPVVAPVSTDSSTALQLRSIDTRSTAMPALARGLAQLGSDRLTVARVILLHKKNEEEVMSQRLVNLEEDFVDSASGTLQMMRECLASLPPTSAGIVASASLAAVDPAVVIRGLISERPVPEDAQALTLLRHGFRIQRHSSLETCDLDRLQRLLETSFERKLDREAYFERLRRVGRVQVVVAGEYQGAVIVTYEDGGEGGWLLPYLDKFAVMPGMQGTGMSDILWKELMAAAGTSTSSLLWRSRSDNGVNRWYFDRSHGHWREAGGMKWVFFWHSSGKTELKQVRKGIKIAKGIPPSFL